MQLRRRDFLRATGAAFCAAALQSSAKAATGKPNIILCMADDQGWGDMAYYGHPILKTPNFDAMAAETLRFDQFHSAAPVCSPTRASVMTGRHPNRMGCFSWGRTLRPQETTIAEALKTAGYTTGHFGKWHLGPVQDGSPVNPSASGFDEWFSAPNFYDNDAIMSREGTAVRAKGESSMIAVDAAVEFMRKHADETNPFFAVVWFGSPHNPHVAAEEDLRLYPNENEKMRNYYGEITGMDRAFGKLRVEIETLGIRENTILWYCSDNGGTQPGTTGGRGKKGSIYQGGLRVPALFEWPARIKGPRITQVPCNTSDIYPTLLGITGVAVPNQCPLDGIDLGPLLDGKMDARPKPMGFWAYPGGGVKTPSAEWMTELLAAQRAGQRIVDASQLCLDAAEIKEQYPEDAFEGHAAWLDWPWKLHRIEDKKGKVTRELYNLAEDPMEEKDLLEENAARANRMKDEIEAWLASVTRSLNGKDY